MTIEPTETTEEQDGIAPVNEADYEEEYRFETAARTLDLELPAEVARSDLSNQTIALFLALYLLVLAFFIVLVTISTPQEVKSNAVMDSLTSTFTSLLAPTSQLTTFVSQEGEVISGEVIQEELAKVFETAFRVIEVEIIRPGRLMRATLETEGIFLPGKAEIREPQFALLDRLVATLSESTPGLTHSMEFLIGSPYAVEKSLPVGNTLESRRAGAFVQAMLARGVPPRQIAIGIRHGDPAEIELRFTIRDERDSGTAAVVGGEGS